MDSDMMLGIHMFGDVQTYVKESSNDEKRFQMVYDADAFDREFAGTDEYANLITLIENQYGDWAYRVLDRYTAQALWSLADEHGAHNALELIQGQDDPTETL
jgi:hypothetical protein